jgi:aminopeptidase N
MTKKILCGVIGLVVVCGGGISRADTDTDTNEAATECVKSENFLVPPDAAGHLNYAPDREVAVLHFALDVTPDFKERTVAGTAVWQFKPMAKPVQEIKLDAVGLKVESVTATEKIEAYQVTQDHLIITFAGPIPADKEAGVTITYHAEPDLGLYFRTPEMGYKEGDTHCFSQGEEIEARHWYPCFDSPNEKFTSEITCRVPDGMTAVSNGRLVSDEKDAATGLTAFHWSQEQPHANYLITLVAGYFKVLEGKHKDVPLAFLTPPSEFAEAANSFRETDGIMDFFEHEIGVPFPWAKYDQICVNDFVAGGMENTSATTLTDGTLFRDSTENIRDSQSLESHEMAHQWFGDLVTCKDWSHIWLNEGFATYYQVLFNGHKNGRDAMLYDLYGNARRVLEATNDVNPIVRRDYGDPSEMFGYLAYQKGAWVLHMLHSQLGEDLYRRCIKTYLERHRYGNVITEDLRAVIEELSGRSYDQFFNQWLYHAHYPELAVDYSWDERTKLAKVSIRQTQDLSNDVLLFDFPLTIRFNGKFGTADRVVEVKELANDFYLPLASAPETVRVDPEYTLLAKITFELPDDMLFAQLADQTDMIGRLLAIEQLADRHDKESVAKLKQTLNDDSFYGVRVEAAKALRTIHTDDALTALLDSGKQSDARVRRAVVTEAGGFFRATAGAFTLKVLAGGKNPDIEAAAIQSLGVYETPEVHALLVKFLDSESYREVLAGAAITAIRSQDDPAYIAPLLATLTNRQAALPSRVFSQGLGTLASLARNEEKKEAIREFLTAQVNKKKQTIQRANRKPADDLKNLRAEVMDLQKANRSLRKDVDDLKKKVEARDSDSAAPGKKRKPSPQKDSGTAGNEN